MPAWRQPRRHFYCENIKIFGGYFMSTIYNDNIILIYIKQELGERHKEDHVHVRVQGEEFSFMLNDLNNIIDKINNSNLSKSKKNLLKAIMSIYINDMRQKCADLKCGKKVTMLNPISVRELHGHIGYSVTESCDFSNREFPKSKVVDIEPRDDYSLLLFNRNGEIRAVDFVPIIAQKPWGRPLRDIEYFMSARLDNSWRNSIYWGDLDIELDIDELYDLGQPL